MPRLGFETVSNVKQYQENLVDILGYKTSLDKYRASAILQQEIARLKDVRNILLSQEKKLFSAKSIDSYENLLLKIEEWNISGADVLLSNNNNIYTIIKEIQDTIQIEDFNNKLQQSLYQNNELQEIFYIDASKYTFDQAINIFMEGLSKKGDNFRITSAGREAVKGNKNVKGQAGLLRYVTLVHTTLLNGKPAYKVSFNQNVPQRYKKRIYDIIETTGVKIRKITTNISQQSQNQIINIILSKLPINGKAKQYIGKELLQNFTNFGFNQSAAAIKGALGEIYWTAFWKFISNGRLKSSPIGTTLTSSGGQVPIDIILRGLGFQVKNYLINPDGFMTMRRSMTLEGFLEQRLEINPIDFENFYTSWGYNKVINTSHAEQVYRPLFERFEKILNEATNGLQGYAETRLDRILKVDSDFQSQINSQLNLTGDLGVKTNVAYLIGDKIVFGSDIITAIIQQLENGYADVGFQSFEFMVVEPIANNVWPNNDTTSGKSLMNQSKVRYEIYLDVNSLVNSAINRLK